MLTPSGRISAAELRLQKELSGLNSTDLHMFKVWITMSEGVYANGVYGFTFSVGPGFPHDAPKIKCLQRIFHPNIDVHGNVCLNILREDWKPVLSLSAIVSGLQFLLMEPNSTDALNEQAGQELSRDPVNFARIVKHTMHGGEHRGLRYDCVVNMPRMG